MIITCDWNSKRYADVLPIAAVVDLNERRRLSYVGDRELRRNLLHRANGNVGQGRKHSYTEVAPLLLLCRFHWILHLELAKIFEFRCAHPTVREGFSDY